MNTNGQFREDEVVVRRSKVNGEWIENRYVKIGGKLRVLHQENDHVSIATEVLKLEPDYAVCRAIVTTAKGTFSGIGVATIKMDSRIGDAIVSLSETRAVARACRHAGYAMDSCGAEELVFGEAEAEREQTNHKEPVKVSRSDDDNSKPETKPQQCGIGVASAAQVRALQTLSRKARYSDEDIANLLAPFKVSRFQDLPREAASRLIGYMQQEIAA